MKHAALMAYRMKAAKTKNMAAAGGKYAAAAGGIGAQRRNGEKENINGENGVIMAAKISGVSAKRRRLLSKNKAAGGGVRRLRRRKRGARGGAGEIEEGCISEMKMVAAWRRHRAAACAKISLAACGM